MGKCWLSVGKQRREARSSSDQQGFLGRTNFCRYDLGMDATDDTILLALEIEEAQRNAKETLLHQPVVPTGPRPDTSRLSRPHTAHVLDQQTESSGASSRRLY